MMAESERFLTHLLLREKQPVTYRILSRKLDIHVDSCKRLLYDFYESHKGDEIEPTYVITGKSQDKTAIKLCTDLTQGKSLFSEIHSIHIYSLNPTKTTYSQISSSESEVNKIDIDETKIRKWGLIQGPIRIVMDKTTRPIQPTQRTPIERTPIERKPAASVPPTSKSKQASIFGSSKPTTKVIAKPKSAFVSNPQESLRDRLKRQSGPKEKVIVAETREEDDLVEVDFEEKKKDDQLKAAKRKELESMFDDDDDFDMSDGDVEEVKSEGVENAVEDTQVIDEMEIDPVVEAAAAEVADSKEPTVEPEEPKVTNYVDEDGYLVTKVEKKPTVPKPSTRTLSMKRAAPTPKTDKKKSKGQSSLMSFFGKKQE